jgi:hypothetical protein
MSLIRKAQELARQGVPLDRAEAELRRHERASRRKPTLTGEERMRRDRQETAEGWGVDATQEVSRLARLHQWLGWDLAPPPEDD